MSRGPQTGRSCDGSQFLFIISRRGSYSILLVHNDIHSDRDSDGKSLQPIVKKTVSIETLIIVTLFAIVNLQTV